MNYLKSLIFLLLLCVACSAQAQKKAEMQKVYVFGFSSSFTDSLAYITDVQVLDSAYIEPNGFLADRVLYSLQLSGYLYEQRGLQNPTTAFFFADKRSKVEKKYLKVKRLQQKNSNVKLIPLGVDEFRFRPEEYIEPGQTEYTEPEEAAAPANVEVAPWSDNQ